MTNTPPRARWARAITAATALAVAAPALFAWASLTAAAAPPDHTCQVALARLDDTGPDMWPQTWQTTVWSGCHLSTRGAITPTGDTIVDEDLDARTDTFTATGPAAVTATADDATPGTGYIGSVPIQFPAAVWAGTEQEMVVDADGRKVLASIWGDAAAHASTLDEDGVAHLTIPIPATPGPLAIDVTEGATMTPAFLGGVTVDVFDPADADLSVPVTSHTLDPVTVTGAGWLPDSTLTLTVGESTATVFASPQGAFQVMFAVSATGRIPITVTDGVVTRSTWTDMEPSEQPGTDPTPAVPTPTASATTGPGGGGGVFVPPTAPPTTTPEPPATPPATAPGDLPSAVPTAPVIDGTPRPGTVSTIPGAAVVWNTGDAWASGPVTVPTDTTTVPSEPPHPSATPTVPTSTRPAPAPPATPATGSTFLNGHGSVIGVGVAVILAAALVAAWARRAWSTTPQAPRRGLAAPDPHTEDTAPVPDTNAPVEEPGPSQTPTLADTTVWVAPTPLEAPPAWMTTPQEHDTDPRLWGAP